MSLINEALKKAQRQRREDTGEPAAATSPTAPEPGPTDGVPTLRRGKDTGANTLLLVGSGALVLVVLSVVVTVVLLNRPDPSAAPAPGAAPVASTPSPAIANEPLSLVPPLLVAPVAANAAGDATPAPAAPTPVATQTAAAPANEPAPTATAATPPAPAAAPAIAGTESKPAAIPAAPAPGPPVPHQPDERIAAFVDAIKVAGIRSSGADSRVLMNEKVYRVNDTVERSLGVKLIKVGADHLTFVDARGVEYVKSF